MTTSTPPRPFPASVLRWLAVGAAAVALTTGCSDDDAEPVTPGGETEVDGGEVDAGDGGGENGSSTSGESTSGGTQGNVEVDDPGQPEPTTQATAQDNT